MSLLTSTHEGLRPIATLGPQPSITGLSLHAAVRSRQGESRGRAGRQLAAETS